MTKWHATVKESLLKDGKACNQLKRIKLSINSLAQFNPSFHPTNSETTKKSHLPTKSNINLQKKESIIHKQAAKILLEDIGLRLADQYSKCLMLINQIKNSHEKEWNSETNSNVKNDPTEGKRKVIRAVNHPAQNTVTEHIMLVTQKAAR